MQGRHSPAADLIEPVTGFHRREKPVDIPLSELSPVSPQCAHPRLSTSYRAMPKGRSATSSQAVLRLPPGESLWEQSRFIARDGVLRNFLLNEPRGGVFRHVNLLVPAKVPEAQMGFIIMEPEDKIVYIVVG
jgi:hypothetical protein